MSKILTKRIEYLNDEFKKLTYTDNDNIETILKIQKEKQELVIRISEIYTLIKLYASH